MRQVVGNIWEYSDADWICIPTNGFIKKDGTAVMGRGLAAQARKKYDGIDQLLGEKLRTRGNHIHTLLKHLSGTNGHRVLLSFPVKEDWRDPADIELIRRSCKELRDLWVGSAFVEGKAPIVVLPRVGCGNGRLEWKDVKKVLEEELPDDSFVVISLV